MYPQIGLILGLYGFIGGFFQVLFFPRVVRRWGPRRVLICGMAAFAPIYALFAAMSVLARWGGLSLLVWAALAVQVVLAMVADMAFGERAAAGHRAG